MTRQLLVLGAGASRAAVYGEGSPRVRPPLNADFFTQLQRLTAQKQKPLVRAVIKDVLELHGSNFSVSLEDYFTQLEFLIRLVDVTATDPGGSRARFSAMRDNLMAALSAVLEESTRNGLSGEGCQLHRQLVSRLQGRDVII